MEHSPATPEVPLPPQPIDRLAAPVARFLHVQAAGGVVLLACTLAALGLANSPWADAFQSLWKTPVGLAIGAWEVEHSLRHWINDGLMAVFFFVIGLEIKRELVIGELREWRLAALPIAAALGGMVVPAGLYLSLQAGTTAERGWGIPMATDIAFVVGCLALLGSRVPRGLRTLLLSLAIADDVGAILVIAVGYTEQLHLTSLAWGVAALGLVLLMARLGVLSVPLYVFAGAGVWWALHESGVHATIAGVILGLLTPARPVVSKGVLAEGVRVFGDFLDGDLLEDSYQRQSVIRSMELATREARSPLERLENSLHPWVSFIIMPVFALANAGVVVELAALREGVAIAVMVGLCLGKPVGIVVFSWLAVRSGVAKLPAGVSWGVLAAGGVLAGIGFTMALFIASLALDGPLLDAAKIGVLSASALCAAAGLALLALLLPRDSRPDQSREESPPND
jgi:NhaA family Na+:H+ antiporter